MKLSSIYFVDKHNHQRYRVAVLIDDDYPAEELFVPMFEEIAAANRVDLYIESFSLESELGEALRTSLIEDVATNDLIMEVLLGEQGQEPL